MTDVKLSTITVDGLSVETTEAGAKAIQKLTSDMADTHKQIKDQQTAHDAELAAKDAEIATKDAEIDDLKAKILSDEDLDKLVKDRADLISIASHIADKDYTGMNADDIRKAAVVAKLGAKVVDGKSVDYINARFDILAEDADVDGVREKVREGLKSETPAVDEAHFGMLTRLENAWKQEA